MVTVRDVQRRHGAKGVLKAVGRLGRNLPDDVLNTVGRDEIKQRLGPSGVLHDPGNPADRAVRQEHRTGLGTDRQHVASAVVLLVATGPFVLLDDVRAVVFERKTACDARLFVPPHPQSIRRRASACLPDERCVALQRAKATRRLVVHDGSVWISSGREIDFGARHVEKAERIAVREQRRFVGSHHVVGNGGDLFRSGRRGTKCTKRKERGH